MAPSTAARPRSEQKSPVKVAEPVASLNPGVKRRFQEDTPEQPQKVARLESPEPSPSAPQVLRAWSTREIIDLTGDDERVH
ncbi:hypothetical protein K458DRAFT_391979 [Lentithecium fluviatile CBS 122367]|uniref:Uncharacterized protein n=1 Tax=Lentithecium fluviatile CBS 122367 TaxID=1168545 RepID=A0A6G1ISH3_9PLEO|nr:hypothetical protein K458DRAFT_391979 [Lentithecium fluviatile CBS 122367]